MQCHKAVGSIFCQGADSLGCFGHVYASKVIDLILSFLAIKGTSDLISHSIYHVDPFSRRNSQIRENTFTLLNAWWGRKDSKTVMEYLAGVPEI
jgi:hypothetical protein